MKRLDRKVNGVPNILFGVMIAAAALIVLSGCESVVPHVEGTTPEKQIASPEEKPTLDSSLEDVVNRFLDQVKAEKSAGRKFPGLWGLTPVVKRPGSAATYEDSRTIQVTAAIEEKLLTSPLRGEIAFSLVEIKEMERFLGQQAIQFSDLYREDDSVELGQFMRAQAFLLGSISGRENDHFSLALVDATTRAKYAQVNTTIPPDPTPPPSPLALTLSLRAEPLEGRPTIAPARDLHDGAVVYSGEGLVTFATLSESAYLYVFVRFSQGDVIPVFPAIEGSIFHSPGAPQNPLPGNRRTSIPAEQFSYAWDDHPGREVILFIASRTPLSDLDACVKKLVEEGGDPATSKKVWENTLATTYLTRGISGVVKTKQGGKSAATIEFKAQGRFVGGKIILNHR